MTEWDFWFLGCFLAVTATGVHVHKLAKAAEVGRWTAFVVTVGLAAVLSIMSACFVHCGQSHASQYGDHSQVENCQP